MPTFSGGDSKEEVVGEEALSELNLSQGEQFTVSDLETLATLQAELDRLHHEEVVTDVKEETRDEESLITEEETLILREENSDSETLNELSENLKEDENVSMTSETVISTGEEVTTEEVTTETLTTDDITEEITTEEISTEEITTEEVSAEEVVTEEVSTEEVTTEEITTEVLKTEGVTTEEESSAANKINNDEKSSAIGIEDKSAETLISSQPLNVIKNAFSFPGQIMKVTVSGGQIVSTKMIGQYSPKLQVVNNAAASSQKTTGGTTNVVHLKPVKKVAMQPKPVSFHTIQGFRTFTRPAGVKRAAPVSVDQSRNQASKVIINSELTPQPVILAAETTTNKTVPVSAPSQNIKVITGVPQNSVASPSKSITLVQAKQMGLLGSAKLQQIIPSSPQKSIVVNKISTPSPKKVTLMKSPSKILPAPGPQGKGKIAMQKIFLRQGNALKPATFLAPGQQVIRLQNPQNIVPSANLGTLHQIQLPGSKQVQFVRVVGAGNNAAAVVPNSSVSQTTVVSVTTALTTATQSEVKTFPVTILPAPAPSTSATTTLSNSNSSNIITISTSTSNNVTSTTSSTSVLGSNKPPIRPKVVSIAPARPTGSGSLLYTVSGQSGNVVTPVSAAKSVNVVMLPTQFIQQVQQETKSTLNAVSASTKNEPPELIKDVPEVKSEPPEPEKLSSKAKVPLITPNQANGIRPRKPCNCTRSQCLKLYCDCFASGEFCYQCNCNCCYNNLEHEEDRQLAIKSCLERNPNAFRPKIGRTYATDSERRHTKGCNCKRSGCLKNYCECYEAKIPCSNNCKCVGCRNIEDGSLDIKRHREELREEMAAQSLTTLAAIADDLSSNNYPNQPSRFCVNVFSTEVLEATVQCLLAQAYEAQDKGLDKVKSQELLLEEYGRCLKYIIDFSSSRDST